MFVYVSSWNNFGGEPGIGRYRFDTESGKLTFIDMCNSTDTVNVSFFDKTRNILYVSNEINGQKEFRGSGGGRILAYKVEEDGQLAEISRVNTYCPNPSYITLNSDGTRLLVTNYSGFSATSKIQRDAFGKYSLQIIYDDAVVELFEVLSDGSIGELLDVSFHTGSGPKPMQQHPRPHCIVRSPSGNLFAVCDKGNDRVYMYTVHDDTLSLCGLPYQDVPGSMPRYCVFHPTAPYLYVNHEGSTELSVFRYDEDGVLTFWGSCKTVSDEYASEPVRDTSHDEQQGIAISPDGRYIYDIINGPDVIAVLQVDQSTGIPILVQNKKTSSGNWLRGGTLSPDGKFLITVSLKPGDIEVFRVMDNGRLESTDCVVKQSAAAYVSFAEI